MLRFPMSRSRLRTSSLIGILSRSNPRCGTHEGDFLGVAATGRRVEVNLVDLWRIADGRIVEQWGGPDTFDLLRQLGAT
ncbi:MAG: ester cyclase [Actinomycetota bacterium]|nr:ester cyclase [Actinomycetota bacterium]